MNNRKMKLDKSIMLSRKARNKSHIDSVTEKLIKYYADKDKRIRLEKSLCKYCFYYDTSRIGGSAITAVICALCDKEIIFGNTCVDVICPECAKKFKLCKHCGQKLD